MTQERRAVRARRADNNSLCCEVEQTAPSLDGFPVSGCPRGREGRAVTVVQVLGGVRRPQVQEWAAVHPCPARLTKPAAGCDWIASPCLSRGDFVSVMVDGLPIAQ